MQQINVGICGLGTVGYGSFCLLKNNAQEISRRLGKSLRVSHIATRKLREHQDIGDVKLSTDPMQLIRMLIFYWN